MKTKPTATPRTPQEIEQLYKKIKAQQRELGEPFSISMFVACLGYNSPRIYHNWVDGTRSPSAQALLLMDIIEGKGDILTTLQLLRPK